MHKGYGSIRNGDNTLTECFEENPEIRNKVNKLWENVTTVDTFFAKRNPSDEEYETAAQVCEQWCKMKGLMNAMFRLEQECEHAHKI